MNDMHLALHGVAIKKHAPAAAVAGVVGLSLERAEALLAQATASGRLLEAQGGYALTPAGRMILDNQYSRFCDSLRADAGFIAAYERFERVNVELKQVITDWQTLDVGGQREVTLGREIDFLKSYLEIERTRIGERLTVEYDVHPAALDGLVPTLILQPLVENAVKHGMKTSPMPLRVTVTADMADDGRVCIEVTNSGEWIEPATGGTEAHEGGQDRKSTRLNSSHRT